MSHRFGWTTKPWTAANAKGNVHAHPDRLRQPYTWKGSKRVFVDSMSDLFHAEVPDEFIAQVFRVMNDLPRHTFVVLTKRPERLAEWPGPWVPNIWAGVSVEDRRVIHRIDLLRRCGAAIRCISFEPLIGPVGKVDLEGIHWVIVGGESGPNYRPMHHAWVRAIRNQCTEEKIAFFFKQDSDRKPEQRPWLIEEDGAITEWRQYPERPSTFGAF